MAEEETLPGLMAWLEQRLGEAVSASPELYVVSSPEQVAGTFRTILDGLTAELRERLARHPVEARAFAVRAERQLADPRGALEWVLVYARWVIEVVRDANCT